MIEGLQVKDIEQIYEEMIDAYTKGDYLDGYTQDGDDALMGPKKFGERFHTVAPDRQVLSACSSIQLDP